MNNEIFNRLLDQAERDFQAEAAEIDPIAHLPELLHEHTGELGRSSQNPADLASETVEREIAAGLLAETSATLEEIHAARRRLAAGTFGRCESCGQNIGVERLRAVPWARRCVSDERTHEAESGGYGNCVEPSAWLPDEVPDDTTQESTWDPEDDHPVFSAEESAIHEMPQGASHEQR